ncbi:condensation domain-containing protein [Nocardia sp. R6R-6]|uniref:condensation domain-containing protein n=1 Tax=Nocardia sp. R6R-6 TaxID=3459303 RepID=UPI00403DB441
MDAHPLSYSQELMLAFGAEAGFTPATWNHQIVIDVIDYDDAHVRDALRSLCRRHEILRTRFEVRHGRHCQVVAPADGGSPHRLRSRADGDPAALVAEEAAMPFDLYGGPLLRSAAIPLPDGAVRLVLTINHLISDRESETMLATELTALYEGVASASAAQPAAAQYAEFARWQRVQVASYLRSREAVPRWQDHEARVAAWGKLYGADAAAGQPTPGGDRTREEVELCFTPQDLAVLTAYGREQGVTMNTLVLTALCTALSAQPDLGLGLLLGEKTVRNPYRFARTLGPFADLWPIEWPATGTREFGSALAEIQQQVIRAIDGVLPFHVLVGRSPWLARELWYPARGRWVLYQYFADPGSADTRHHRIARVAFPDSFGQQSDVFGLHVQVYRRGAELRARLSHRLDSLSRGDVQILIDRLRSVISAATERTIELTADVPEDSALR